MDADHEHSLSGETRRPYLATVSSESQLWKSAPDAAFESMGFPIRLREALPLANLLNFP